MSRRPPPAASKPKPEQDAENKAKEINDIESEPYKVLDHRSSQFEMRKEIRALIKTLKEEERLLSFY
jgi:hypothetical protein